MLKLDLELPQDMRYPGAKLQMHVFEPAFFLLLSLLKSSRSSLESRTFKAHRALYVRTSK